MALLPVGGHPTTALVGLALALLITPGRTGALSTCLAPGVSVIWGERALIL